MANTTLTQTGAQVQTDLDKVEGLANIKTIGSGLSLSEGGELSASGGITIGGGYKFRAVYDGMYSLFSYMYLGVSKAIHLDGETDNPDYNKYGWHFTNYSGGLDENVTAATQENVSLVVIISFNPVSGDFTSITQNALYLYDGTVINDYNALFSAIGKLCYLRRDCEILFED